MAGKTKSCAPKGACTDAPEEEEPPLGPALFVCPSPQGGGPDGELIAGLQVEAPKCDLSSHQVVATRPMPTGVPLVAPEQQAQTSLTSPQVGSADTGSPRNLQTSSSKRSGTAVWLRAQVLGVTSSTAGEGRSPANLPGHGIRPAAGIDSSLAMCQGTRTKDLSFILQTRHREV